MRVTGEGVDAPPIDGALRIGARENRQMIDLIQNRNPGGNDFSKLLSNVNSTFKLRLNIFLVLCYSKPRNRQNYF